MVQEGQTWEDIADVLSGEQAVTVEDLQGLNAGDTPVPGEYILVPPYAVRAFTLKCAILLCFKY